MSNSLSPLAERLPLVTYTNRFKPEPETIWVSPQVEWITGYPPDAWTAKPGLFARILHPDDRASVLDEVRASRRDLREFNRDYRVLAADGRVLWLHDESVPVLATDGTPQHVEGYFVDISERKELELRLLQAKRSEALGRLAAGIAHDFNNLLTAITGHSELARKTLAPDAPTHRHLAAIVSAVERGAKLTRQLLAFSGREQLDVGLIDVTKAVEELEPVLRLQAGSTTRLALDLTPTAVVQVDVGQFEQVLIDLVAGAREADARRIKIGVGTVSIQAAEARKLGIAAGDYVRVTVTDDGAGRDEATAPGLSLAHTVIRQGGGVIDVSSAAGTGSNARILLPLANLG